MTGISNIQLIKIVCHRQSKNSIRAETENTKGWNCKIHFLKIVGVKCSDKTFDMP